MVLDMLLQRPPQRLRLVDALGCERSIHVLRAAGKSQRGCEYSKNP